jgi:arylsulfatase A-like enzyme
MIRHTAIAIALSGVLGLAPTAQAKNEHSSKPPRRPNILFVIMDDVGFDQVAHPPIYDFDVDVEADSAATPTIDALAVAGVSFGNAWSMPACSTSRAVFFTGRYPFRTGVLGALGENDLANSMVSEYETTAPKLLKKKGYESALFGKFHIALENNPAGPAAPHNLGWDFFSGWWDVTGDPSSIDRTAGGVIDTTADSPAYSAPCGFIPSGDVSGGADEGACYLPNGSCSELILQDGVPPGRACRDWGGILVPDDICLPHPPPHLNWRTLNSHFVSPVVFNFPTGRVDQLDPRNPRSRTYRAKFAVDEAISWINARPRGRPWMASVSFAADHTPLVQPPADETPALDDEQALEQQRISDLDCSAKAAQREISDLMISSLDRQVARLLVEIGLATQNADGSLNYDPANTDTMVILLGDNGSLAQTVKEPPGDASRAKGSPYQTGVWVPLIIAGPLVQSPSRLVTQMVNIADLFSLFGEIAGIKDIAGSVAPRRLDAHPMLPYLEAGTPPSPSIRETNFTQIGVNVQQGDAINPPCTINTACTQIPVSASVCADNDGIWWGWDHTDEITNEDAANGIPSIPSTPEDQYTSCCQVNAYVTKYNRTESPYTIDPPAAVAIRDETFKLVRNTYIPNGVPDDDVDACATTPSPEEEFYLINETLPLIDRDGDDNQLDIGDLDPVAQVHYDVLSKALEELLQTQPACSGDGNGDLVVDRKDLRDYRKIVRGGGGSSHYDFNHDAVTDDLDKAFIDENLGTDCRTAP